MNISWATFKEWGNQIILHDEDLWDKKYKTYAEMWEGEGYTIGDAKGVEFTDRQLELLSDGIIALIHEAMYAPRNTAELRDAFDNYRRELQRLNTKICNYMEG